MGNKQVKKETNQKGKRDVIRALILIALVLIMILLGVQCSHQYGKKVTEFEESVDAIAEIDTAGRQDAVDAVVEEGMINVNYLPNAIFKGTTSVKFNIKNIKNNHGPIVFELYDENDNCIYKSKMIKPGYEMNCIELEKELKKGKHDCQIKVEYAEGGNVNTIFPLTIEVR